MKGTTDSYDVLCHALRERFGEPDIECRLLGEVVNRTQGPLEAGLDYLDSLLAIWALVSEPLPVRLQLNFAYNNLRSEYHVVIHREDFSTFGELYRLVRDYDRPRRRMQPRTPVTPNESVMPKLAYQPDRYLQRTSNKTARAQVAAISYVDLDHRLWDEHVHEFRHAYNTAVHSSSHVSPAMLNYGWQPRPPKYYRKLVEGDVEIPCPDTTAWENRLTRLTQLHDLVTDNLGRSFERQARYYNRHHRDERFAVGDVVRVRQHVLSRGADRFSSKLARKYSEETYTVSTVISPVVYELADQTGRPAGRQHVKALRLVRAPLRPPDPDD
ncbi:GSCOCG00011650001-RA-CDS [Cotesia congregata]|nr:GSCOCG00011650001-RA-CDS [Cotesia congregata]